jgi:hypothetical protein
MSELHKVTLTMSRGGGLSLRINDSYVSHTMESGVLRELQAITALPAARIDANVRCATDPRSGEPAASDVARWIATELKKDDIWQGSPEIALEVSRGAGLYLQINGRPADNTYGTIVMAELAQLREDFPAVRVDVAYRSASPPPPPASMARLINTELHRNEIWD